LAIPPPPTPPKYPRKLVVQTIILFLVVGGIIALFTYIAWTNYSSFHNTIANNLTWDWGDFYLMILSVFLVGCMSGVFIIGIAAIRYMQKESRKTLEREKLKEEIKRELEAEIQKDTH
jgi:TRAP-type C4-dicarboxylate transport system permease small subunit